MSKYRPNIAILLSKSKTLLSACNTEILFLANFFTFPKDSFNKSHYFLYKNEHISVSVSIQPIVTG